MVAARTGILEGLGDVRFGSIATSAYFSDVRSCPKATNFKANHVAISALRQTATLPISVLPSPRETAAGFGPTATPLAAAQL